MHRLANRIWAMTSMACMAAILATAPRSAQARLQAVIVESGEVEVGDPLGPLGPEYDEHSLGQGHEVGATRFINHDDHIPAQLCHSFGFVAWLAGGPGDVFPVRILMRITHPKLTRPDGASSSEDTLMIGVLNGTARASFEFDYPWEAEPGEWTFDLIWHGEVLASKTFIAIRPAPGSPAPACPGVGVS